MSEPRVPSHPVAPMFTDRWSPRAFTGEPMDTADLMSCLEAARWAPSAYNAQPWRFVYGCTGSSAFATLLDGLLPFNQVWAKQASALVLVLSATRWMMPGKTEPQALGTHTFDAGAAWASLALQARLLGWHSHGMAGIDHERLRASLQIPEGLVIEAAVAIGRLADASSLPEALRTREFPSDRRPLSQLAAEAGAPWPAVLAA